MKDELSIGIREAIASGDYSKASELWDGYFAQLRDQLHRGTLSSAAMDDAGELVNWSRTKLICARAHTMDGLATLRVAGIYVSVPNRQEGCLKTSG